MADSPSGMAVFEQNAGGAPANVLACGQKLGVSTAFIGKVGEDLQGEFLRNTLEDAGISTEGLLIDKDFFTTLAFVSLDEKGERSFSFARKSSADTQIKIEEINIHLFLIKENLIEENIHNLKQCILYNLQHILIDDKYIVDEKLAR